MAETARRRHDPLGRRAQLPGVQTPEAAGDLAFFYHSGGERRIVGIVEGTRPYYPDPSDPSGRFGMVDARAVEPMPEPVTLAAVKAEPRLADLALVRQSRLSVMPIDEASWRLIRWMGG